MELDNIKKLLRHNNKQGVEIILSLDLLVEMESMGILGHWLIECKPPRISEKPKYAIVDFDNPLDARGIAIIADWQQYIRSLRICGRYWTDHHWSKPAQHLGLIWDGLKPCRRRLPLQMLSREVTFEYLKAVRLAFYRAKLEG